MKFLCPTCKAKYQIADEKVSGRSVRMKCRKCGHLISISKAITESSVSRSLSTSPPPADQSAQTPAPTPAPRPAAPTPTPAPARPPPKPGRTPAPPAPRPLGPPPRAARPTPEPPLRAPAPRAPGPRAPLAAASGGLAQVEPSPKKNGNGASKPAAYKLMDEQGDEDRTVIAGMGALAGAFSEQVHDQEASALASSLASTDEWYVGINGVPVGPIRLSELRSKASAGAITVESLVWRDGFEQWLPLSNFPELVAIVEEGLSSARASLTPFSPPYAPTPPPAPRPQVYDPFAQPAPPQAVSEPFASPFGQQGPSAAPQPFGFGQPQPQVTPFGPATGNALVTEAPRVDEDDVVPVRRRGGTPPMAWVAMAIALALGLTIGFVAFNKKSPETVVQYVPVPATGGSVTTNTLGTPGPDQPAGEVEADAGSVKIARTGGPNAPPTKASTDKPGEKPLSGLSGLQGLTGTGPTAGPGTGDGPSTSSGKPLDSAEIQKTVGKYTGSVKRSCWQPALDARSKDAPTSARVVVTVVVGPSGSVQSVSTSGDPKGYPGLAGCIASRVRGWQFPPSSGTTTVNVPFVFAAQ